MSRRGVYDHRIANEKFALEWDNAVDEAVDLLEAEARRRAYSGVDKPVHYKGQRVDMISEYSDGLMMFLLKAHRPHKYREKYEFTGPDDGPIEIREIKRVIVDS